MPRIYADQDAAYLRSLEAERIELVAPTAQYYSLNLSVHVDPLYNEPTNDPLYGGGDPLGTPAKNSTSWDFEGPHEFPASIQYEEMDKKEVSVRSEGMETNRDAEMLVSRNHWEEKFPDRLPKEGDVVFIFDIWWDVVKEGKGGNIADTRHYVSFKLELKKRDKFTPDRKI